MIEAGVEAISLFDFDDPHEWKVDHIYREMERTRRRVKAGSTDPAVGGSSD
jgi:hypothetical protein